MSVQQAVGLPRSRGAEAESFLKDFVERAKSTGFVAASLERHKMIGRLVVAPPAAPDTATLTASLAPKGVLRAGINVANFLLVSGKSDDGKPQGVAPDMVAKLAQELGLPVELVPFESPGKVADAVESWDVGLIGADPARASKIAFTAPYVEIPASYLVPAGSAIKAVGDVDKEGTRIATVTGSAFDLWLKANIKHATLVDAAKMDDALALFKEQKVDALAGLRQRLTSDAAAVPGSEILAGQFMSVQQAIGVPRSYGSAAEDFLKDFVERAKSTGFVAELLEQHKMVGRLVVAPASDCGSPAKKRRVDNA